MRDGTKTTPLLAFGIDHISVYKCVGTCNVYALSPLGDRVYNLMGLNIWNGRLLFNFNCLLSSPYLALAIYISVVEAATRVDIFIKSTNKHLAKNINFAMYTASQRTSSCHFYLHIPRGTTLNIGKESWVIEYAIRKRSFPLLSFTHRKRK